MVETIISITSRLRSVDKQREKTTFYFFNINKQSIMKKFFSMMMIAAAALFAACGETPETPDQPGGGTSGNKLETPAPTVAETGDTWFTISWEAIANADSYTVNFKGKNYSTAETSYKFENLNAGEYTVRVKATGKGYTDSAFGTVTVTLTGATSVDWFTASAKPAELNEEEGYAPYNAIEISWKGTGVATLAYGVYYADNLEGVSDSDIKNALTEVKAETVAMVNSADGLTTVLGPFDGDTTFAVCVLVKNAAGIEFLSIEEVTTEAAEPSEAAKAWMGTWTVNSTQKYSIDQTGEGTVINEADTFNVTITASANDPDEVIIDGWSVLGEGQGYVTFGSVDGDTLYILNGTNLGTSSDGSFYYYWLGWYSELIGLSIDAYPSNVVTNVEGVVSSTNKFNLYYEDGTPAPVECYASDVFGVTDSGSIYFLIESFPGVYRTGDMTWTKGAAAAQAANVDAMGFNPTALKSSVVLR